MPVTVAQSQRLFSQAQSVSASETRARGSRAGYALVPCSTTARNPIVTLRQLLCVLNPGAETGLPSQERRVRPRLPQLGRRFPDGWRRPIWADSRSGLLPDSPGVAPAGTLRPFDYLDACRGTVMTRRPRGRTRAVGARAFAGCDFRPMLSRHEAMPRTADRPIPVDLCGRFLCCFAIWYRARLEFRFVVW